MILEIILLVDGVILLFIGWVVHPNRNIIKVLRQEYPDVYGKLGEPPDLIGSYPNITTIVKVETANWRLFTKKVELPDEPRFNNYLSRLKFCYFSYLILFCILIIGFYFYYK